MILNLIFFYVNDLELKKIFKKNYVNLFRIKFYSLKLTEWQGKSLGEKLTNKY